MGEVEMSAAKPKQSFQTFRKMNKQLNAYTPLTCTYQKKNGFPVVINLGCGNTCEDLLIISACFGTLWCALLGFYAMLMKAAIDTDEKSTALYMYMYFSFIFLGLVMGAVHTGDMDRIAEEKKAAADKAAGIEEA